MAVICVVVAYLMGNISPAILLSKAKGKDIREEGSGNAGTTNMLRIYGKKTAALTFLIDVLKGAAAVLLGFYVCGATVSYICAVAVVLGHVFPVVYGFRGGKGVATGAGAITAVSPIVGFLTAVVAFSIIGFTKKVSLGSLAANFFFPLMMWLYLPEFLPYAVVIVIVIFVKHRSNVRRLIKGEESKIKF